jgi:hypothetical protein
MPPDFFISYASPDTAWAEWLGWVLEEEGASVVMQAWDFVPGSNFVLEMQQASGSARRTIAILSPDYLTSRFAPPEWAAAFAQDPEGIKRSLVPVRVRECALDGLLRTIVHIDLVGLDEPSARKRLSDGLSAKRAKPDRRPVFPGEAVAEPGPSRNRKPFPGEGNASASPAREQARSTPYMPRIRGAISDLDRSRFLKQAFETVRSHFQRGLAELQQHPSIDVEFTPVSESKFTAQVFVNGTRRARCKIWLGGILGMDQISYHEGDSGDRDSAFNEALTVCDDQHELALSALMKMGFGMGLALQQLNLDWLTEDQAANYLWCRFASALE